MDKEKEDIFCTNCGVEITWLPLILDSRAYCCQDCLDHLPCECAGVFEIEEDRSSGQDSVIALLAAYTG